MGIFKKILGRDAKGPYRQLAPEAVRYLNMVQRLSTVDFVFRCADESYVRGRLNIELDMNPDELKEEPDLLISRVTVAAYTAVSCSRIDELSFADLPKIAADKFRNNLAEFLRSHLREQEVIGVNELRVSLPEFTAWNSDKPPEKFYCLIGSPDYYFL